VVAPETGLGAIVGAVGPAGATIASVSIPTCALLIKRMVDDSKIVRDPPRGSLRKLARPRAPRGAPAKLPSCATFAAEVQSFCRTLGTELLRYVNALRHGDAIDDALVTTVDRVSGAARAHNRTALALQKAHASALRAQLRASDATEHSAGVAIANLLREAHVAVSLTPAQTQRGASRLLAGLARGGFKRATVERLGRLSFAAAALDGLSVLGEG
jgi:hypothetical protein